MTTWGFRDFPGCLKTIKVYRVIAVEGDRHGVSWTDDGIWFGWPAILLFKRTKGDKNIVIGTVRVRLDIKTLEGQLDSLSWGDL